MSELIEALEESNFILRAMYDKETDSILKNGIEKRLLKNAEAIARGKVEETSQFDKEMQKEAVISAVLEEKQSNIQQLNPEEEVKNELLRAELLNIYQLNSPKNKGFIISNIEYYDKGPRRYKETIKRIAKNKDKATNIYAYIITSLKNEFNK